MPILYKLIRIFIFNNNVLKICNCYSLYKLQEISSKIPTQILIIPKINVIWLRHIINKNEFLSYVKQSLERKNIPSLSLSFTLYFSLSFKKNQLKQIMFHHKSTLILKSVYSLNICQCKMGLKKVFQTIVKTREKYINQFWNLKLRIYG